MREIEEKASNYMRGRAMALSFKPLSLEDVKEAYLCGAEDYAHISKPVNPWHKASEELPYRNGIYLIRGIYENLTKDMFYSTSAYDVEYGKFINYPSYGIITHWMPIPEIKED